MSFETSGAVRDFAKALNAPRALLRDLIDYAGLFPPASLTMAQAVANYDSYLHSEWNWILGRFIVPVARLGEFEETCSGLPRTIGTDLAKWRLSVLLGADPGADVEHIRQFNHHCASSSSARMAVIESVEVKVANAEEIARLSKIIPVDLATYFEIPLSDSVACIAAVAECGRRAKIRTGGETPDKFPPAESVIEFIHSCVGSNVPFKATAGLHHPLRSAHRLTYQPDSPSGMMHGFLNVFLAAAFLRAGMPSDVAVQLMKEQSEEAFHFDLDGVAWRQHRLTHTEIAEARCAFAISFGSCSFTEPIADLRTLHLL
jgi:hypothetical protein